MKKRLIWFLLTVLLLSAVAFTVSADDEPFWSNMNSDPVKNGPKYFISIPIKADAEPVLLTRIRTYHWNSGNGAQPGTISIYEGEERIGTWQAVGRSAFGSPNVYWEALVEALLLPGHTYRVRVSDSASWSYNEGSRNCGMFELYGEWPAPEGYVPSAQSGIPAEAPAAPAPTAAPVVSLPQPGTVTVPQNVNLVPFGTWEQDGNTANGPEPILWQVIETQYGRQLLLSRDILAVKGYNDMSFGSTWESSSFRSWLNGAFYNSAFTAAEKARIALVKNDNPDNAAFGTRGGNKTDDRIFLLSIPETERTLKTDAARIARPTAAAAADAGTPFAGFNSASMWFLRTPGYAEGVFALVGDDGAVNYGGPLCTENCDAVYFGIRPAFWLATPTGFSVTYDGSYCLTKVPTDGNLYQPGDKVKVLFDPVEYVPGFIFYGWDADGDGVADYGYAYDQLTMPNRNVTLTAICYMPQPQYPDTVTRPEPDPVQRPQPDPGNTLFPPGNYDMPPDYYGVG